MLKLISRKKSLILIGSVGGVSGLSYYFLRGNGTSIVEQEEPVITRDRSNLLKINWKDKLEKLKINKPVSIGLQAAHSWIAFSPDIAINWMKLACEDPKEKMSNQEWKTFCEE